MKASNRSGQRACFAGAELDVSPGELHCNGKIVRLSEQPFQILLLLLERPGEVVTRGEIRNLLWPNDTIVEFEHSISAAMNRLRQTLGDSAENPRYIQTLARRGYRWILPVEWLVSEPKNTVRSVAGVTSQRRATTDGKLFGKKVSHYRVLEILGGGGMGLVYKAEDLRLGRRVALKFLAEELAADPLTLQRFEREARTASTLNHPNICTIHEVDEYEGQPFIVMELLEGQTLRDLISAAVSASAGAERPLLPIARLLDIAIQIANGLDAAHQKGIIHRDIKPANIFVTTYGQAKILDFGLAKLAIAPTESATDAGDDAAGAFGVAAQRQDLTLTGMDASSTRLGTAIGTAGYMSPEQVRGEKLDTRTDLFSFGSILYEMATLQRASSGDTSTLVHSTIFTHTPLHARQTNAKLPAQLEAVINKALEKTRELRYQCASEMRADLKCISAAPNKEHFRFSLRGREAANLAAVVVAGLALLGFSSLWFAKQQAPWISKLNQRQLTANSSENPVTQGAISPDGKYLAYVDLHGVHIKLIQTGETQTVPQPETLKGYTEVEWLVFPWSQAKFIAEMRVPGRPNSIWTVPIAGGAATKLRDNGSAPSVSPDGATIAFSANRGKMGDREIWLMDANGERPRKLYRTGENSSLEVGEWSPDGQRLACRTLHQAADKLAVTLEVYDVKGDVTSTLLSDTRLWSWSWLRDGRFIYSLAEPSLNGPTCNYWQIKVDTASGKPRGKPIRLTNWTGFCNGSPTATKDSTQLADNRWWIERSVYIADVAADGRQISTPHRLTQSDGLEYPSGWTADSKAVVFVSNRNGKWRIFKHALDEETTESVVTSLEQEMVQARMSPNSSWALYESFPGNGSKGQLLRAPMTGGPSSLVLKLVTPADQSRFFGGRRHQPPRCAKFPATLCAIAERSSDGKQLVFTAFDPLHGRGHELTRIVADPAASYKWDLSPDGTRLAVLTRSESRIRILSLEDEATSWVTVKGSNNLQTVDWGASGLDLFVSSAEHTNSVLLHVDLLGNAQRLWQQHGEQEGDLDVYALPSPDGRHLAIFGWTLNSNMWILENF